MKTKTIRVALSFATFSDNRLNTFVLLVIVCLKNNALFPNLPVSITDLIALQASFQDALTAALQGGPLNTAAKNGARAALILALRRIAAYIQSIGLDDLSDFLSSGFDVVIPNNTQTPLDQPWLSGLDNSVSMQLQIRMRAVTNAKVYQVQFCIGNAPWQEGGIFHRVREIVLMNLIPGTIYTVRIRAIGGSTGYSDWSVSISRLAT